MMRRSKQPAKAEFVSETDLTTEYLVSGAGIPGHYRAIVAKRTGHVELLTGARRQPVNRATRDRIMPYAKEAIARATR